MKDYTNNDMIHIKFGNVEYLQCRKLTKYNDKLIHAFFLRKGGISKGVYESLNIGSNFCKDSKKNMYTNLKICTDTIKLDTLNICKAVQAHTDNIVILDNNNKEEFKIASKCMKEYDGYITNTKDISTYIVTADCNPIIIYDPIKNIVANIHSGWKGTIKKIYLKAAILMKQKFNSKYSDMIVCVGPSINKCCFNSSDEDFKKKFIDVWSYEKEYIEKKDDGKIYIDLLYVIKKDFLLIGLKEENIILSNICTKCNEEDFFSYRNKIKNNEMDFGRQGCFTSLK